MYHNEVRGSDRLIGLFETVNQWRNCVGAFIRCSERSSIERNTVDERAKKELMQLSSLFMLCAKSSEVQVSTDSATSIMQCIQANHLKRTVDECTRTERQERFDWLGADGDHEIDVYRFNSLQEREASETKKEERKSTRFVWTSFYIIRRTRQRPK